MNHIMSVGVFFFQMVDNSICPNKEKRKKKVSSCHSMGLRDRAGRRWRETETGERLRDEESGRTK